MAIILIYLIQEYVQRTHVHTKNSCNLHWWMDILSIHVCIYAYTSKCIIFTLSPNKFACLFHKKYNFGWVKLQADLTIKLNGFNLLIELIKFEEKKLRFRASFGEILNQPKNAQQSSNVNIHANICIHLKFTKSGKNMQK